MGNFLSGAHARLIFSCSVWRAADIFTYHFWHTNADLIPLAKDGRHAL